MWGKESEEGDDEEMEEDEYEEEEEIEEENIDPGKILEVLIEYYNENAPDKINSVDTLIKKYEGNYKKMAILLEDKYHEYFPLEKCTFYERLNNRIGVLEESIVHMEEGSGDRKAVKKEDFSDDDLDHEELAWKKVEEVIFFEGKMKDYKKSNSESIEG